MSDEVAKMILSTLEKIDEKVDRIDKTLAVQEKTLQVQAEQLSEHIRRTNLLEVRVEQTATEFKKDLRPVEDHVRFINRSAKVFAWVLGIVGVFAGIGASIAKILGAM